MIFAFLAQNEHGRALIALIRAMRACRNCFPELYITCAEHRAELDRLYPEHCPDADCPACTADVPPPAKPAPEQWHIASRNFCAAGTEGHRASRCPESAPAPCPGWCSCRGGSATLRAPRCKSAHDNGDYRD